MKYFLDTEFLEGTQKTWFGQTNPTIDLISIGIVAEDGREYYAISKDFNLKEAWNRYDETYNADYKPNFGGGSDGHYNPQFIRDYWIRDNVLKPIFIELRAKEVEEYNIAQKRNVIIDFPTYKFDYKSFKKLINKYGKSNKHIAEEIKDFISYKQFYKDTCQVGLYQDSFYDLRIEDLKQRNMLPQFYGYYSDYDWVVFCWLFGRMIDLPKGFPMYCIDLKQWKDQIIKRAYNRARNDFEKKIILDMDNMKDYPKQINEHNALDDARWNYELYKFLNTL